MEERIAFDGLPGQHGCSRLELYLFRRGASSADVITITCTVPVFAPKDYKETFKVGKIWNAFCWLDSYIVSTLMQTIELWDVCASARGLAACAKDAEWGRERKVTNGRSPQ